MITISLCIIVKNEEDVLARCLQSVSDIVDEIVVIDTGSEDRTKEIAAEFTERIFDFEWTHDFSAARNEAFSKATMDYILWIDADDILEETERAKLSILKQSLDPGIDSVTMHYHLMSDEYGNVTFSLRRNRLVKRSRGFRWIGAVHEYLEVYGTIIHSDIAITHAKSNHSRDRDSQRNLKIYEQRLALGESFSPRDLYYYANELKDHGYYKKAVIYYEKFLNGKEGWIEDNIAACTKMADCYHELGDKELAFEATLRALKYGKPRAELCCRLGYHYLSNNDLGASVFWYEAAAQSQSGDGYAANNPTFSTWLPHLQLAVCYDRLGNYEQANQHNEQALFYRPGDQRMLDNRVYFQNKLNKKLDPDSSDHSSEKKAEMEQDHHVSEEA